MNRPPLLPLATVAVALLAADDPRDVASRRELERHQGVWVVATFVSDGRETPPELARTITRTVKGDHVVWKRDGANFAGTTVALDPTTSPPSIDVIPDGGPRRDERVLGIYRLEGETLTICMAAPGKERPKEFRGEKGTGQTLMTFQRQAPRAEPE